MKKPVNLVSIKTIDKKKPRPKLMRMAGYTKLFNSILASTIWREDDKTRIVWITILAMSDKNGVAEGSVPGLADFARVTVEDCRCSLKKLAAPDPDSRSKDFEGRRIREVDGGWQILNHAKYRAKMGADERREYNRLKQAEYRASRPLVKDVIDSQSQSALSAHSDSDSKAEAKGSPLTAVQQIGLEKELKRIEKRLDELHASPPPTFTIVNGKALQTGEDTADERKNLRKRKKEIEAVLRKANGGLT